MMRRFDRLIAVYFSSIFCACAFFDGIEAGTSYENRERDRSSRTANLNPIQDYPDFIQSIRSKTKKVYTNEKGFWEAEFEYGIIMVFIPAGEFHMGSGSGDSSEKTERSVHLDGFWIGKYEITFDQYDRFCEDRGIPKPEDEGWGRDRYPAINVSWEDARAYCIWLKEKIGFGFELPTEAQWEKAARGADGRIYPWGNSFPEEDMANFRSKNAHSIGQTTPIGSFPEGSSPYGVLDMAGNVYEWCLDRYGSSNPSSSLDRNVHGKKKGDYRVLRGGSWFGSPRCLRASFRTSAKPDSRYFHIGFRVCLD